MTKKFNKYYFVLLVFFCFGIFTYVHGKEEKPSRVDDSEWDAIRGKIEKLLGKLATEANSVSFRFELQVGESFLGSGSLAMKKSSFSFLEIYSRKAACKFWHSGGSGVCVLSNASETIKFGTASGCPIPVPVLRIEKDAAQEFRFDIQMMVGSETSSMPIQIYVHPETSAHISRKLKEKFPFISATEDKISFFASETASCSVSINIASGVVNGFTAVFPRETGAPIKLKFFDFYVDQPIEEPSVDWVKAMGYTPTGSLQVIYNFITGFYSLLSSFFPENGE